MVDVNRRKVLASIGATTTLAGSFFSTASAKSQASNHEINKLENGERGKVLGEIQRDSAFRKIQRAVIEDGWRPSFSETKCFEVSGEDTTNYKYATIIFEKKGVNKQETELVSLWFNKKPSDLGNGDIPRVSAHEVVKPDSIETQSSFELIAQNEIHLYTVEDGTVKKKLVSEGDQSKKLWDSPQEREKALDSSDGISTQEKTYPRNGDSDDSNVSEGDPGCYFKYQECDSIDWSCLAGMIGGNILAIAGCAACAFDPEPVSKTTACAICLGDFTVTQIANFDCYTSASPAQDECETKWTYIHDETLESSDYFNWSDCDLN